LRAAPQIHLQWAQEPHADKKCKETEMGERHLRQVSRHDSAPSGVTPSRGLVCPPGPACATVPGATVCDIVIAKKGQRIMPDGMPATAPEARAVPRQRAHLTINNVAYDLDLEPRQTLLDTLRDVIGLTGAKPGCNMGNCGACTVLLDGEPVYSC